MSKPDRARKAYLRGLMKRWYWADTAKRAGLSRREKKQLSRLSLRLVDFDLALDCYHPQWDYWGDYWPEDVHPIQTLCSGIATAAQRPIWTASNSGDSSVGIQGYQAGPHFARFGRMYRWFKRHTHAF